MIDFIGLVFCSLLFILLFFGIMILFASETLPVWLFIVIASFLLILFVIITVSVSKNGLEKVARGIWLSLIKIIAYLYKKQYIFYKTTTLKFLPIQKKLFSFSLISGIALFVFDIFAWVGFLNADDYGYGRGWYLNHHFLFPNPKVFTIFARDFRFKEEIDYYWYSDRVLFTGILFLISLSLLLVSFIVSMSAVRGKNEK